VGGTESHILTDSISLRTLIGQDHHIVPEALEAHLEKIEKTENWKLS